MWVLTVGVLEVNLEMDSIRAQGGRARSALLVELKFRIKTKDIFAFSCYGNGEGEFDCLAGVAVNKIGQYIIADRYNHRIQIFDPSGHFLRSFGSQVTYSNPKFVASQIRVCSSTCQTLACHFLMCHFGDLAKILVPKLWQGILATKWHAIFNVPFWTLRKNFGAKILARYFNVPFC